MKKYIVLAFSMVMILALGGCSLVGGGTSAPQATPAQTTEPEVTTEPTPSTAPDPTEEPSSAAQQPEDEHETTEKLPQPQGSEGFIKAFNDNEIDKYYTENMNEASSVTDMVQVATKTSQAWETLMNTTYDRVMEAISTDADKIETITNEQKAWVSDINIKTEEIKAESKDAGSMSSVQVASKIMLMYRERCAQLLSELYEATGSIEIKMSSSEAVG